MTKRAVLHGRLDDATGEVVVDQSVLLAQLVIDGAQLGLLLVLGVVAIRVATGIALAVLARLSRRREVAVRLAAAARCASPAFLRTAVAALAGAGLVLGLASAPAVAAVPTVPGPRPAVPLLDRVVTQVVSGSSAGWRDPVPKTRPAPRTAVDPPRRRPASDPRSRPRRAAAAGGRRAHVVAPGDSLWSIASQSLGPGATRADVARAWPRWFAANRGVIGPDPDLLRPGQRLQPPDAA